MYQSKNPAGTKYCHIVIDGKYSKSLFRNEDEFIGKVKLGDKTYFNCSMKFNRKNYMADLETEQHFYGLIYINNIFQEITIVRFEQGQNGVYSSNGWYISAPCKTREEAVAISNRILRKNLGDKYTVEIFAP